MDVSLKETGNIWREWGAISERHYTPLISIALTLQAAISLRWLQQPVYRQHRHQRDARALPKAGARFKVMPQDFFPLPLQPVQLPVRRHANFVSLSWDSFIERGRNAASQDCAFDNKTHFRIQFGGARIEIE